MDPLQTMSAAAVSLSWSGLASTAIDGARFVDPEVERRYRTFVLEDDHRAARLCLVVVGAAVLAFAPTDWTLFGASAAFVELALLRLAYAGLCALCWWHLRRPLPAAALTRVVCGWTALTVLVVLLTNATRPPGVVGVLATHFPLLLLLYTSVPLQQRERLWLGWGYSIGFVLVRHGLVREDDPTTLTATVVGTLAIHVFGPLMSARAHRQGRRMVAAIWAAEDLRQTVSAAAGLSEFRYDLDSGQRLQGHARVARYVRDPVDFTQVLEGIHPDDRERSQLAFAAARDHGREVALELRLGDPSGYRWMRAVGVVVGRSETRRGHLVGLTWDIHERRGAELAAEQARLRLDRVLRSGRMQLWEWDPATGQRRWIEAAPVATIHPDDRADDDARFQAALAERREYVNEYRVCDASGRIGWLHARGQPLLDAEGVLVGMAGLGIDITARKHAELLVRRNQRWKDIAATSAALNLWEVDPGSGERRGGELDHALYGCSPATLQALDRLIHPQDLPGLLGARAACFVDGRPYAAEYRVRAEAGARWLSEHGRMALDEDDGRARIFGVSSDITARKRAELALREALDAAHRASAAKSAFLATISHELRTPLNAVIGFAGLLMDSPLDETQRFHARLLRSGSQQLLALINNVLDFSRIEAGELPIEQAAFVPEECIEACIELVSAQAEAKGLTLTLVAHGPTRRPVLGDATRVRQVAINLLTNAIKFTHRGGVRCELLMREEAELAWFGLRVADSGIGISEEVRRKLFQPFQQGDASTTRRFGGSGLGLSISLRLVRLMGGEIEASGASGLGSEFVVTLPLRWHGQAPPIEALPPLRLASWLQEEELARALAAQLAGFGIGREVGGPGPPVSSAAQDRRELDAACVELDALPTLERWREWPIARNGEPLPLLVLLPLQQSRLAPLGPHGERRIGLSRVLRPGALRAAMQALATRDPAPPPPPVMVPVPASGVRPRLLIVEDNSVNRLLLQLQVESLGYFADAVTSGREALDLLAARTHAIVLMDIEMPEMDGMEATRRIRAATAEGARPWIIAVTAHVLTESRTRFLEAGVDDVLTKPVVVEQLREALARAG